MGGDSFGAQLLELWKAEGVDTSGVEVDPDAHTGLYFVQHGPQGHSFSYLRRDSAASRMTPASLKGQLIERARYLHVSGISLAISTSACDTVFAAIERAHAAGVQVSLDSNLRLRLWPVDRARAILREALRQADLFLPSMDDMQHLTGNDDRNARWTGSATPAPPGWWCSSWARTAPSSTTATGASRWRRCGWRRSTPPARATASPAACWPAAARAIPGRTRCAMPCGGGPVHAGVWRGRALPSAEQVQAKL